MAGPLDLQARTQMVVDHHFDQSRPGKPLWLLIPGGFIAIGAIALAAYVGYQGWVVQTMDLSTAQYLLAGIAVIFIGGTFAFSYGYELYNLGKAIRLTVIIVVVMAFTVLIVVVLFMALGSIFSGSKGGSSRSRGSGSSAPFAPLAAVAAFTSNSGSSEPPDREDRYDRYETPSRGFSFGGNRHSEPNPYQNTVLTPPAAPPESWVPAASDDVVEQGPPMGMPPPAWLPSDTAAPAAPVSAQAPLPVAAPVVVQPVALPPIVCPSCGLSFSPIAGRAPICPNCGAGFALPPAS
jgi:hypothetical protein